ncbi:MAG: AAA family ATPase, partial [Bacillales bacterium]|nr:AAA family ATPase [Bacillales bacterium]
MIFKRNIYNELIEWKKEQGKSSILVEGARRVGKSTLVENFAKENYKTYILIDFNNISAEIRDIFLNERANIDTFYLKLSLATGIKIYRRKTLLIFDEVQKFPIAREYTKYIVKDNRCDCICTGSLISIKKNTQGISIPSEERKIKIYPLDFEEFLLALNEDVRLEGIKAIVKINQPIGNGIHRTLMEFMRLYIVIGGMPQAVAKYLETKDFDKVDKIKREILGIYRDDILANGDENKYKILNIFDNIPSQLNKSYKKFILNKTLKGDRIERNVENFVFLEEAMLINRCFLCNNPNIGLNQNRE